MESPNQKFVLRMTCSKNGGFKKYHALPPQEVFQHAYWMLSSELEVKIKQKQTFFNRKTPWMFLPVYMAINKGLLFIYTTYDSGYALKVSAATQINFQTKKKHEKTGHQKYKTLVSLQFSFGEVLLKIFDAETARTWRTILLAAHETPMDLSMVAQDVSKKFVKKSESMESVVSAKSLFAEDGEKDKSHLVEVYRHHIAPETLSSTEPSNMSVAEYSIASSIHVQELSIPAPRLPPPKFFDNGLELPTFALDSQVDGIPVVIDYSPQPNLSHLNEHAEEAVEGPAGNRVEESPTQSYGSFEDKVAAVGTYGGDASFCEIAYRGKDGTEGSHTTACKTSPNQITRHSSFSSITSRRSLYFDDFRGSENDIISSTENIVQEFKRRMSERALPQDHHRVIFEEEEEVDGDEKEHADAENNNNKQVAATPKSSPEAQKLAAVQSNEFVHFLSDLCRGEPLEQSVSSPAAMQQQEDVLRAELEEEDPFANFSPKQLSPIEEVSEKSPSLTLSENMSPIEIAKRVKQWTATTKPEVTTTLARSGSFAAQPSTPRTTLLKNGPTRRLSNLEFWRMKEAENAHPPLPPPPAAKDFRRRATMNSSVREIASKYQVAAVESQI